MTEIPKVTRPGQITRPGMYDVPHDLYHGAEICDGPSISASGLKLVRKCPAKYWWNAPLNPKRPAVEKRSKALNFGTAAHDWLLLGRLFLDGFTIIDDELNLNSKDGKAAKAEAAESGRELLRDRDLQAIDAMRKAIEAHPFAGQAFRNGYAEKTLVWKDRETGVWLRCKPDFLPNALKIIPDYKTTADASPEGFQKAIDTFGYFMQAPLYLDGIEAVFGERPAHWVFVAQEKEPPYVVELHELTEEALYRGSRENRTAIRRFAECLSKGHWPGYSTGINQIDLPAWTEKRLAARHDAEDAAAFETQTPKEKAA